jgi:hypothetical protein
MANTRIRSDNGRLQKEMEISSFMGRYQLTKPGPGLNVGFIEDPHIRLQYWGTNLRTNKLEIENELTGRTTLKTDSEVIITETFPEQNIHIIESRTDLPAWTFRTIDNKYNQFEYPFTDPQKKIEKQFPSNVQSRMMEKHVNNTIYEF